MFLNLNFILVLAKKYIHDCKMTSQNITFLSFLVLLHQELSFEEQICTKNQREQEAYIKHVQEPCVLFGHNTIANDVTSTANCIYDYVIT